MAVLMREEGASSHDSLLAEIFTASETECINISCGRSSQHVDGIVEVCRAFPSLYILECESKALR